MRRIPTAEELVAGYWRKLANSIERSNVRKRPRTVAASSAKLRKVAGSNSRARSGINQTRGEEPYA